MSKKTLYIHFPWCIRKCPYCDFNSHKSPTLIPEKDYIESLLIDFDKDLLQFPTSQISSIFLGGGTPSLFSAESIASLFESLKSRIRFEDNIEITMEANPGTVEQQRFQDYFDIGINRLSLGIQSFHTNHLKSLGRIHDDNQARLAIETARKAGFRSLNIDLMHSLPNQSINEAINDLREALSYQPEHLSWYQLTLEPNTVFYKKQPKLPDESLTEAIERQGFALLNEQNYNHYEISAFSKEGKQSKHNLNYWTFGDYFGIGAGAHGKLTKDALIYRTTKFRQPNDYLNKDKGFLASINLVDSKNLIFEFMLNLSRLNQPVPFDLFRQKTGLEPSLLEKKLIEAQNLNLVELTETHWKLTDFGRRFTNDFQALFLA